MFGKLGLRSATDSFTATLQWRQVGDDYRIRLSGPFGAGALQIEGDEQGVTLRTGEGQEYAAGSQEELLYQHLGWSVPLSGLRYWMLGRTPPEQEVSNPLLTAVSGPTALKTQSLAHQERHFRKRPGPSPPMPPMQTMQILPSRNGRKQPFQLDHSNPV